MYVWHVPDTVHEDDLPSAHDPANSNQVRLRQVFLRANYYYYFFFFCGEALKRWWHSSRGNEGAASDLNLPRDEKTCSGHSQNHRTLWTAPVTENKTDGSSFIISYFISVMSFVFQLETSGSWVEIEVFCAAVLLKRIYENRGCGSNSRWALCIIYDICKIHRIIYRRTLDCFRISSIKQHCVFFRV